MHCLSGSFIRTCRQQTKTSLILISWTVVEKNLWSSSNTGSRCRCFCSILSLHTWLQFMCAVHILVSFTTLTGSCFVQYLLPDQLSQFLNLWTCYKTHQSRQAFEWCLSTSIYFNVALLYLVFSLSVFSVFLSIALEILDFIAIYLVLFPFATVLDFR